ncbi:sensor histidine kinase [Phytoactinopolyspora alkaliphila]|uniref:histidine kinase n=1 Tax=Phytoactinopolyspora alkaliphila TaxID=1783498 RepID=A0A6N9YGF7_9ACTN|nr:sensor histidine kinase [Phytoactinopolyspora alkaliphila]NED94044.1 sensor histidine kinase [Phytoactinopolyspora alkaliphila]
MTDRSGHGRLRQWVRRSMSDLRRSVPYLVRGAVTSFGSLIILIGLVVVAALLLVGVGWLLLPPATRLLRWWTGTERRRVEAFTGASVPEAYPPLAGSLSHQIRTVVLDRTTRRDTAWLTVHGLTGHVMGVLAVGLPLGAVNAALVPAYWWILPEHSPVNAPHAVTSWADTLPTPLVAAVYALLALALVPRFASWQTRCARTLLAPPRETRLRERVTELTASRAAALEAHGSELRRIERDLHDGAQNRLVEVVMQLGIAERAWQREPASALPLILRAQDAAGSALGELRDVVRSIYPPILTERGLDGALAALAARCPIPCTLRMDGLRRVPAAVESAAYFVVAEALTNVAKHSGAEHAEVRVTVRRRPEPEEDVLVVRVTDDGRGGATERAGTGLAGIRRRVAAFDGRTELSSPDGGPTQLEAELPCGS